MNSKVWVLVTLLAVGVVTLAAAPAEAQNRKIVVEGFSAPSTNMSLQLRLSGLSLSDDKIDPEGAASLGGMNLAFTWDPVRWGGLEVAAGGYERMDDTGLIHESRGVVTLSWLWYFSRHKRHRFYGVTGLASSNNVLEIGNSTFTSNEGGYVLGLGSEWLSRSRWMVNFDVRALFLERNGEDGRTTAEIPTPPDGIERAPFPEEWTTPSDERFGLMFNFGIGYRW